MLKRNNQNQSSGAETSNQELSHSYMTRKMILLMSVVVVVVIAAVVLGFQFLHSKNTGPTAEEKTSGELVANIKKKDSSAVYGQLSSQAQKATDQKAIQALVEKMSGAAEGSIKEVESNASTPDPEASDHTKRVEYEITGKDGKKSSVTVTLIKEDNQWKILNFYSSGP